MTEPSAKARPTRLRCPACHQSMVAYVPGEEVLANSCVACGSVWLDAYTYLCLETGPKAQLRALARRPPTALSTSERTRRCPVCDADLKETSVQGTDLRVDLCADHGVYFDHGELGRLFLDIEKAERDRKQKQDRRLRRDGGAKIPSRHLSDHGSASFDRQLAEGLGRSGALRQRSGQNMDLNAGLDGANLLEMLAELLASWM